MGKNPIDTRNTGYPVFFQTVPEMGTQVVWWGGHTATLYKVSPYTRRDGNPSNILHWRMENGRTGRTGLRGKGMYWDEDVGQ